MELKFEAAACSHKGLRRHNNEDNFCLNGRYMDRDERDNGGLFTCDAEGKALFAVCDGMGGEEAGEEASLLSCELCTQYLQKEGMSTQRDKLRDFMRNGCVRVLEQAQKGENRSGSTVAVLLADEAGFVAANMGDSRIYRLSANRLTQISEDHTEIQRLLKQGAITRKEIKTHPKRHMIRQYWGMPLGIAPFAPFISSPLPYGEGEKYLLCSDGLTDMVEDRQIESILRQNKPVREIAQELVDVALKHGGRDNVTVVVLAVHGNLEIDDTVRDGKSSGSRWRKRLFWGIIGLAACAGAALAACQWLQLR